MKNLYVICFLVSLALSSTLMAQTNQSTAIVSERSGVRTSSNIPESELKDIYIATINNELLHPDQKISYDVINGNFPSMTQRMFQKFQENVEGYTGSMDILWLTQNFWLLPQNFQNHPYYCAFYCIYLSKPINQGVRGFQEGTVNVKFVTALREFIGCSKLAEELRDQLPNHANLILDNWDIVTNSEK